MSLYNPTDYQRILKFMGHERDPRAYLPDTLWNTPQFDAELIKVKKAVARDNPTITDVVRMWDKAQNTADGERKSGIELLGINGKLEFAKKLDMACLKDSRNCFISQLFFRIVGLFKGRGFNTEAEWGQQKAREIRTQQLNIVKLDFRSALINVDSVPNSFFNLLNNLSNIDFNELLEISDFTNAFNFDEIYLRIDNEKKNLFLKRLLIRSDWFEQILKLESRKLYGSDITNDDEKYIEAYNQASRFVEKFIVDQVSIQKWFNGRKQFYQPEITYFGLLLQLSIRHLKEKGNFKPSFVEPYKEVLHLLKPVLTEKEHDELDSQGIVIGQLEVHLRGIGRSHDYFTLTQRARLKNVRLKYMNQQA